MIEVFTSPTPNGIKVPMVLEELGTCAVALAWVKRIEERPATRNALGALFG